jgi:hypothetical protein
MCAARRKNCGVAQVINSPTLDARPLFLDAFRLHSPNTSGIPLPARNFCDYPGKNWGANRKKNSKRISSKLPEKYFLPRRWPLPAPALRFNCFNYNKLALMCGVRDGIGHGSA